MRNQMTNEQVETALKTAWIPKRYRANIVENSLSNYGAVGGVLKSWVDSPEFRRDITAGLPRFIVTEQNYGMDIFYVLARAMILRGIGVRVIGLPAFLELSQSTVSLFIETQVLFLGGFYVDGYDQAPMSPEVRYRTEWLLANRMRDQKMMVFQATSPIGGCKWWSRWFLQLVADLVPSEIVIK